jgi:arylsulfatase A-like enzyme
VKYADFALGKYLEDAAKMPWFADTVFVIIADHTADAAGKTELSPEKYHIPFLIYSPGFIEPRVFDHYASQIDVEPIVLGLLDFSCVNRFDGENLLRDVDEHPHVYVANYQKLGYLTAGGLTILRPDRSVVQYTNDMPRVIHDADVQTVLKTIAVYGHASHWQQNLARVPTLPESYGITPQQMNAGG